MTTQALGIGRDYEDIAWPAIVLQIRAAERMGQALVGSEASGEAGYLFQVPRALVLGHLENLTLEVLRCLGAAGIPAHLMTPGNWTARLSRHCRGHAHIPRQCFEPPHSGAAERIDRT